MKTVNFEFLNLAVVLKSLANFQIIIVGMNLIFQIMVQVLNSGETFLKDGFHVYPSKTS